MKALLATLTLLFVCLSSPLWAADSITVEQLKQEMSSQQSPIIIDVRDEDEFLAGHIPGAIMVPAKNIEHHLDMLEQYKKDEIVLYCVSGRRASAAATALEDAGFRKVRLLEGNYPAWQADQ
ncbi:MAG: rhodanese-like domain-containing protein [Alcanivorax sediminis]|uniref:rhodanese-like domain-containing protein n=1 Tax=Alcanivorax sediminis TaxID=2663008 RepID=UPI003C57EE62